MTEKKKRETRKPIAVVYTNGKNQTYVTLCHPTLKAVRTEKDGGPYKLLGRFQDLGYVFAQMKDTVPNWAKEKITLKSAEFIGYCVIQSSPWV